MSAAITVKIAARSGRSRHSSRSAEQQEHDAERVDLAPDHAVEPGDRVDDDERGADQRRPLAAAELPDHRPDEPAEREVGEDRRDLDQVADAAAEPACADDARRATGLQVAGRVVVEERPLVEAVEAVRRRGCPPSTGTTPRSTSKPEPGRRYAMMSRKASPRARTARIAPTASRVPVARRRLRARVGLTGCGASQRDRSPARAMEGGWERSRGSPGGLPQPDWPVRRARSRSLALAVGVAARRARAASSTGSPAPTASTTTSSGRRWPSSTARRRSTGRSRRRRVRVGNDWFQDVLPSPRATASPTRALLPFPPLPAIVLLPFVAIWGLATDIQRSFSVARRDRRRARLVGARRGCRVRPRSALATTLFFGFGTVFWYAAQLGDDVVLRPRRRGRVRRCSRSASRSARIRDADDEPARRTGAPAGDRAAAAPRPARGRCRRSTGASSSPGSCSGSPARPG